jgi:general stress protein CsbA
MFSRKCVLRANPMPLREGAAMELTTAPGEDPALTYSRLRSMIGIIGLLLPAVLFIAGAKDGHFQDSLSSYYYTHVGNYFTGTMCVMGVFLLAYRFGTWEIEDWVTDVAGICALGVAFFHAAPAGANHAQLDLADVHLSCAGILFGLLGVICYFFFPSDLEPADALHRRLYKGCGLLIWVTIVLMIVLNLAIEKTYTEYHGLYWLETICVLSFSASFIVKGYSERPAPGAA